MKKIRIAGVAAAILLSGVAAFFIFLTVTDYRPADKVKLELENNTAVRKKVKVNEELTVVTGNIGFGAMDNEMHFFVDGGTMSRAKDKDRTIENIKGIISVIGAAAPDFILAQEIDLDSTRSYKVNEYNHFKEAFKSHGASFTVNFKIAWLPAPILKPHGKVLAGQASFANKEIISSRRISLPINESWPSRLWTLDSCLLETRISVENNKELVIFNAHLSGYDKGGVIRKKQLVLVEQILNEEAARGSYVVMGGDYNHAIPGSDASKFKASEPTPSWYQEMPKEFSPRGYSWHFDQNVATCRTAGTPYIEGENFLCILDGFMVSDNIEVLRTAGLDSRFRYSDHNPVSMTFRLK